MLWLAVRVTVCEPSIGQRRKKKKKTKEKTQIVIYTNGGPGGARTRDLRLIRPTL